jgi:hypothetical protein
MAVVAAQLDFNDSSKGYIYNLGDKLNEPNMLLNPFTGGLHYEPYAKDNKPRVRVLVLIKPIYPNFSIFGWMTAIVIYLLWGWSYGWILLPVGIGCLGFFYTDYFYMLMLWAGLKKNGYKGKIRFLSYEEVASYFILRGGEE